MNYLEGSSKMDLDSGKQVSFEETVSSELVSFEDGESKFHEH